MTSDEPKCGCYDGPYTEGSKILVSVRCQEHLDVPALAGFSLMERRKNGNVIALAPRDTHTHRDVALARQRKIAAEKQRAHRSRKPKPPRGA